MKCSTVLRCVPALALASLGLGGCGSDSTKTPTVDPGLAAMGKDIFRMDTFGDETFWTDTLRMNEAISKVDPTTALTVGLKVDAEALPAEVVTGVMNKTISLTDPATTI